MVRLCQRKQPDRDGKAPKTGLSAASPGSDKGLAEQLVGIGHDVGRVEQVIIRQVADHAPVIIRQVADHAPVIVGGKQASDKPDDEHENMGPTALPDIAKSSTTHCESFFLKAQKF